MKLLITGGAGFIGSHLANRLLSEGHEVFVIDNFNDYYDIRIKWQHVAPNLSHPNYKLFCADIENKKSLEKIFSENAFDVIVHLAGRAGVRPSIENPESYISTNILGTVHILELMKDYGAKKIVLASSSSVYGNCKEETFTEDLKVSEPISQYAATKLSDEQFAYTYSKLYGISAVCLRFFTVYGPGQRPDLAIHKFTRLIDKGEPVPIYGDGNTKRDYTYIDDIVDGVIGAISYNQTPYEIVNLGGGEPVCLSAMVKAIETALKKKAVIKRLPMQKGDVDKTVSDTSKAFRLWGYMPATPFNKGIEKFIQWYKKENE